MKKNQTGGKAELESYESISVSEKKIWQAPKFTELDYNNTHESGGTVGDASGFAS